MQGLFITFEGPDGAGKTTQIKKLEQYFIDRGLPVRITREPGGTKISEEIRQILLNAKNKEMANRTELLLYAAARAQHMEEFILPAIGKGEMVISDRFSDSTLAYQGFGRGIDIKLIEHLNNIATTEVKPDVTFLLDLDVKQGLNRVQTVRGQNLDRLEAEHIDFHERVRKGFLSLAEENTERIKVINAGRNQEEIFNDIIFHLEAINK